MATILDLGFLSNFSYLFTFLLVFVLVFAILEHKKILSSSTGINAIIAFCLGVLVTLSKAARIAITTAAPWYIAFFFFIFFLLLAYSIFGASEGDFLKALKDVRVINWIIAISVIIAIISLANALGQGLLTKGEEKPVATELNTTATNTTSFQTNVVNTLFHPKVLGLLLLLIIASFTVRQLAVADSSS